MAAAIISSLVLLVLAFGPMLAGADSRDGRDWQAPSEWRDRRGAPHH